MTSFRVVAALVVTAILSGPVRAQDSGTSLADQWVQQALEQHPGLAQAALAVTSSQAAVRAARAWPDPRVEVTWLPYRIYTARGSQRSRLGLQQSIPTPGLRSLHKRMQQLETDALDFETATRALDISRDVRLAYDALYRLQELDRLLASYDSTLASFESVALTRYETGQEALAPVLNLQLERRALAIRRERLTESQAMTLGSLSALLGRQEPVAVTANLSPRSLAPLPTDESYLSRRPDLSALRSRQERADGAVESARKMSWPGLTVGLQYIDTAQETIMPTADGRDALAVTASIRIPLDRRARLVPVEQAVLQRESLELKEVDLTNRVAAEIRTLREQVSAQTRQLTLLDNELLPRARQAQESAFSAYTSGRAGFQVLLEAERMLFQLHETRLETFVRVRETHARLERALAL